MPAPTGAEPRLVAARAAAAVLDHGQALDAALGAGLAGLDQSRDRALARRLALALMRDWPAVNDLLGLLLKRTPARRDRLVHFILAVAVAELRDKREPPHAVVHAAVEAARASGLTHLAGLVNAVLRNFQRQAQALQSRLPDDAVHRHGYPGWLVDALKRDWPADWAELLAAGNQTPPLWLRVNRRRWQREAAVAALVAAGFDPVQPDAVADALILNRRAAVSRLPGFQEGALSVQDGAAQLTADYLQLADGQRVLDACAAPGGKAAHVLERATVDLTAVEVDAERVALIGATLDRLGLGAHLIHADATAPETWWDGQPFDRILIDAPCSATGVIRRHPDIRWLRRPQDLAALIDLQRRLLTVLWPLLKPGGILVYATCSILRDENEGQVEHFLQQHADARPMPHAHMPGRALAFGRQILPGEAGMDGFYHVAVERLLQS